MYRIIAIAHSKGGVGKSLLSLHLAAGIDDCIIFDLDAQNSTFNISSARVEPFKVIKINSESNFFEALDLYEDSNNILIDVGGYDNDLNRLAIANSDIVVVPVKDNSFEILALQNFMKVINTIKSKSDVKVFALINNVHPRSKDFERLTSYIKKQKNINLLNTIIRQRAEYQNTLEEGLTVLEKTQFSKASIDIINLIEELKDI